MKLLLTNDDGIDAPGLAALEAALPSGIDYIVIAPDCQRSECSHSVTTRHDLQLTQLDRHRWSLNGTPVDCVRVAIAVLEPELAGVLSGVNEGGNLGADVYISGTVAAAREAALHGVPAIALSQYRGPDATRTWDHVPIWLHDRLMPLLNERQCDKEGNWFWNVNLPSLNSSNNNSSADHQNTVPELVRTRLDAHPMPVSFTRQGDILTYKGNYHGRPRVPGTDVNECFSGRLSVCRISLG